MLKGMVLFEVSVVLVSFSKDWELKHVTLCEGLTRLPLCDHRHFHRADQVLGEWMLGGRAGGWLSATPGSLSSYSIISPLRPQLQSIGKVGPSLRSEEQLEEMTGREVTRSGSPAHCCRAEVALMGSPGVQEFPEAEWVRNRPRLSRDGERGGKLQ